MDIQVLYDGVAQPLQVVGFDGVPTGSQDGKRQGTIVTETSAFCCRRPAASSSSSRRPSSSVQDARFITKNIDGGPASDVNPERRLAKIELTGNPHLPRTPKPNGPPNKQRFENLKNAKVTAPSARSISSKSRQSLPAKHQAAGEQSASADRGTCELLHHSRWPV